MTLLEQIAKISEEKELHITNLSIQIECMNNTIDSLKDENIKLRNAIVRLKERNKKSSDKYYELFQAFAKVK